MKSLHKFTSLALLMLFVSMFFVEDAFACSGAYYGWKWANNKNTNRTDGKDVFKRFFTITWMHQRVFLLGTIFRQK